MKDSTVRAGVGGITLAVVLLCLAQTVAVWGEHTLLYNGLPLWAYDHIGGARGVSIALGAVTVPALFSYPAGLLVGAMPPRATLLVCALVRTLLAVALVILARHRFVTPVAILVTAALILLVDSFFMPVLKAALPRWSGNGDAERSRANALLEATDAPGFVLGPLFAVSFYHAAALAGPACALAVSYLLALVLLFAIPRPKLPPDSAAPGLSESSEGSETEHSYPLPFLIGSWSVGMFVLGLTQVLALPFVRETLHGSEPLYGILAAVLGGGVTVGALFWSTTPILRLSPDRRFAAALLIGGVALIGGAAATNAVWCGAAWFLGGIGLVGVPLTLTTLLQTEDSARRRTGLLGLTHTTEAAGLLLGEVAAAGLASWLGLRGAFALGGILLLLCAAATSAARRRFSENDA